MLKKLNVKIINKSTGEFQQYDTKEFTPDTPPYNKILSDLVNHLRKVLNDSDEYLLCIDNVHVYEYQEGSLFDVI